MRSLRARLTFSYAVVVAIVLSLFALAASVFAFRLLARPTVDALRHVPQIAFEIERENPHRTPQELGSVIVENFRHLGLRAHVLTGRRFGRPVPGGPAAGGPPLHGPFAGHPPTDMGLRLLSLALLGNDLRPRVVQVAGIALIVEPDMQRLEPVVRLYLASLVVTLAVAIGLSWLLARWITAQAIAPLLLVTEQLRRFAAGDFTPRRVETRDVDEVGDLIAAYNGAAGQVSAAFSERLRLEEQLRRFLADAGHELRTPLTVLTGYVDILDGPGGADPAIRARALRIVEHETARMRRLVERLMALARLERTEPSQRVALDLRELVSDVIEAVGVAHGGWVGFEPTPRPLWVEADPAELHEAVGNLIDNALKYAAGAPVEVTLRRENGDAVIRVIDGGPGIPPADRAQLFERFFRGTASKEIEGSGLGLAIVRRAIERCGGVALLECGDPGRTTFTLRLHAVAEREAVAI